MPDNELTLVDIRGCGSELLNPAEDFLHYRLYEHDGLFEAPGVIDIPLEDNERVGVWDHDFYYSIPVLGFESPDGTPVPNLLYNNNLDYRCRRYNVCFSRGESDVIMPFSDQIFAGATIIGIRAGDINGDGLFDVIYDTQDANQNIKSFILYQEPFFTEMSDTDRNIWYDACAPVINSHLEISNNITVAEIERLRGIFFIIKDLTEQGNTAAARKIRSVIMQLAVTSNDTEDLSAIDTYFDIIETQRDNPEFLEMLENVGHDYTTPSAFFKAIKQIIEAPVPAENLTLLIELFQTLCKGVENEDELQSLTDLAINFGQRLSKQEIITLIITMKFKHEFLNYREWIADIHGLMGEIEEISAESNAQEVFYRLYLLVGGSEEISPSAIAQYESFLDTQIFEQGAQIEDLIATEKTIGIAGAILLREKFGIIRFGRYHPSMLRHLVQMASDVNHDREKPLVVALVASYDHNDMFYWGSNFAYNPDIRMIVLEVKDYEEFKEEAWRIRDEYGIPDVLFITAHGTTEGIQLGIGSSISTYSNIFFEDESWAGYFGDKEGQIVLNSCSTGARMPDGEQNFAQRIATTFNAETVAPRAIEGLLNIKVEIDEAGRARLVPTFFEVGSEFFGFNDGGMTFYPNRQPVYRHVVDTNTGWQPSLFFGMEDSTGRVGGGFGYSHQIYDRVRFRYDLAADVDMVTAATRVFLGFETGIGLTNQLTFNIGVRGGIDFESQDYDFFMQEYAAFNLVFASSFELGLGIIDDDWTDPSFFGQLMYRF